MVVENPFLQRRQRIDILHVCHTTRHAGDNTVDGRLVEIGQRQHIRGDTFAPFGNQVGRHADFTTTTHGGGQRGQGWLAEQHLDIGTQAGLAHAPDQADRQQRVTTQFEEVIVAPDLLDLEQVGPDLRQGDFGFALRRLIATTDQCVAVRGWQGLAVEFAVGGQWQLVQRDVDGRDHVLRQFFLQMTAQAVDLDRGMSIGQGVIGHQTLVARDVFSGRDDRFMDGWVFGQAGVDLAQFDTETTDLHLVVVTAQVFDITVWQVATEVAGAVHAGIRRGGERVLEETFGGEVVAIQVTPGYAGAADVDLTRYAQRNGLLLLVQQVELGVAHRFADMRGETVFAIHGHPA